MPPISSLSTWKPDVKSPLVRSRAHSVPSVGSHLRPNERFLRIYLLLFFIDFSLFELGSLTL